MSRARMTTTNSSLFIPRPTGSGDIAISMASVRRRILGAHHNFDTLRHILIIFGRNVEEDQ